MAHTGTRSGSPQASSLLQSGLSLIVIIVYAIAGLDPVNQLFFWGGALGGFGVLSLCIGTSLAVLVYFGRRGGDGEPLWRWALAPAVSAVALVILLFFVTREFHNLIAVAPDNPLRWIFPALFGVLAVAGVGWGFVLRSTRPDVYGAIGLGAEATAGVALPTPRTPAESAQETSV